jgi:hypothetical protein
MHVQRLVSVVKMATVLEDYTTEEQSSVVHFWWAEGLNAKDIHEEMFTVGSVCCVKQFTDGSRNFIKDIGKSQMMPDQVTLLRLRQK